MKNYTSNQNALGSISRSSIQQLNLICLIIFLTSGTSFSQQNIWEPTQPKGENPWATEETPTQIEGTLIVNGATVTTSSDSDTIYLNGKVNFAVLKSNGSDRHFNIDGEVVKLNKNSYNFYKSIKLAGKKAHDAYPALGAGLVTGSVISVLALPINLVASAIPTTKTDALMEKFRQENPHATYEERKAFNKGVKERRFGQAMAGNFIGIAVNAVVILVLTVF